MGDSNPTEDRRPALYGSLGTFLVLNNLAVAMRIYAHWRTYYRAGKSIFLDDIFLLLSGVFVNVIIGNLMASTYYGLGLHGWRVIADDPQSPRNMSIIFKHVWVTMVLASPTFLCIKLSLLFFYRRLFLVNQRWLRIAWWANLVYILLWAFGATGFYLFQCWPVQWYWVRYYQRYHAKAPGGMHGQCNATTVQHVAMPLIFGLISDVALLLLPITAIVKLQVSYPKKIGLTGIFSVGLIACLLELARIIELEVDTDDKTDPSYGVVIFLILSVAEEVCAIICGTLPVVIPQIWKAYERYRKYRSSQKSEGSAVTKAGAVPQSRSMNRGFQKLGESLGVGHQHRYQGHSGEQIDSYGSLIPLDNVIAEATLPGTCVPLNTTIAETLPRHKDDVDDARIVVQTEFDITRSGAKAPRVV